MRLAALVFPVFGQTAAAAEPGEGAPDDPAPGQNKKTLGVIRALDDLDIDLAHDLLQRCGEFRALIAARVNISPPFSAPFTLWLSMIATVRLASRPTCSRHLR